MLFGECHTFRDAVYLKLKSMLLMLFHDLQHFMFFVLWCLWSTRKLTVDTHLLLALPSGSFAGGFFCRFKKASSPGSPGTTEKEGWDTFEIRCKQPPGRRSIGGVLKFWGYFFRALGECFFFQHLLWNDSIRFISKSDINIPNLMIPLAFFSRFSGCCTGNSSAEFQESSVMNEGFARWKPLRRFEANCSKCSTPSTTLGNSRCCNACDLDLPQEQWQMKVYTILIPTRNTIIPVLVLTGILGGG